ncbi:HD domain-containing protein [Kiritimatiellota bacterium B12222]|nr:HD domain-containing protein [Kiritimatiellota bacterium B12222]
MNPRTVAVIDIGTASIRMALADINNDGQIQFLEKLNQSVRLGQDVFTKGRIRRSTIEACVRTLESFQQVMREYKVEKQNIRAVASSAVQEASNRESFLDRVAMATGIEIEIVDDAEATRLTYLSVLPFIRDRRTKTTEHTMVLEVGGGRTEILELKNQNIVETRVMRLGSLRMRNHLEQQRTPREQVREVLEQEVSNSLHQMRDEFNEGNPSMILLGGDARFVAMQVNPEWKRNSLQPVSLKKWKQLTDTILGMSTEQCVEQYHLTFAEAETLGPALYTYGRFAENLGCKTLRVSAFSMRDGLIQELSQEEGWTENYQEQMLDSAIQLGRKYSLDEHHGNEVANLSLQLFDELRDEHHLGPRFRVLLQISALLHEIGSFIAATSHHKHSMYILANSPIFGLGRRDSKIVANIARYHRRSAPKSSHPYYQQLPRHDRMVVQQLSAILRVADALARSRGRRINKILCERHEETLFIRVPGVDNLHLENSAMQVKGKMFEQVFGMNVILVKG